MQKTLIAAGIITLFVLVGPYLGIHPFGKPTSTLLPGLSSSAENSTGAHMPSQLRHPPAYAYDPDDEMEEVPSDFLEEEE